MYRITWKDGETEDYKNKKDFEDRLYFLDMICGYVEDKDYKVNLIKDGVVMDWRGNY